MPTTIKGLAIAVVIIVQAVVIGICEWRDTDKDSLALDGSRVCFKSVRWHFQSYSTLRR